MFLFPNLLHHPYSSIQLLKKHPQHLPIDLQLFDSPFSSLGLPQRYSPAARWSSRNRFSLWCGSLVGHQRWVFLIQRKGKPSFIALKCWNINWHCCVIYVIISKYIYIYCIDFKYDSIYNSQKPYSSIMVKLIGVQTNDCDWLFNS